MIKLFRDANKNLFSFDHGDRRNVPNVMIVITDGKSNDKPATIKEAQRVKDRGIR